jgi:hypothetical protein
MGDLKPIGSEKLTGQEKINRILQIARYNETVPSSLNESSRSEYNINLADGLKYEIVKERQGYIIKRGINESNLDYIEPIKNRKYYSSYSQAFKRLNLIAKELNQLNENTTGISLFGEQKKFVLKTPNDTESAPVQNVASEPPPVPQPDLPPSPISNNNELGGDMPPMDDDMSGMNDEMPPMDGEMDLDVDMPKDDMSNTPSTFKVVQKLTGKLTQKLRALEGEEGLTSENIKYVINMILSAVDLTALSEEDKEDIMSKFTDEDEMGSDMDSDVEIDDTNDESSYNDDFDIPVPETNEFTEMVDNINRVNESKIDRIFSNYFVITEAEAKEINQKHKKRVNETINTIKSISETNKQKQVAINFLSENVNYKLIGKTNINNLVFENNGKKFKVTPNGFII